MKYIFPIDPDCPEVIQFFNSLEDTVKASANWMDFKRRHRRDCNNCFQYGLANAEPAEKGETNGQDD